MDSKDSIIEMWQSFLDTKKNIASTETLHYTSWHFGSTEKSANELVELVLSGKKKATSSAHWIYKHKNEAVPSPGDYSIVTDWSGKAKCIIKTTETTILPFSEVKEEMASKEGEGDLSLDYWRRVHTEFFTRECEDAGKDFPKDILIVFEEFEVVYPNINLTG
jgi:uncharacterized protein YhfF